MGGGRPAGAGVGVSAAGGGLGPGPAGGFAAGAGGFIPGTRPPSVAGADGVRGSGMRGAQAPPETPGGLTRANTLSPPPGLLRAAMPVRPDLLQPNGLNVSRFVTLTEAEIGEAGPAPPAPRAQTLRPTAGAPPEMTSKPVTETSSGKGSTQAANMAKLQALSLNSQRAENALMDFLTENPHEAGRAAREAEEAEEVTAAEKKSEAPASGLMGETKKATSTDEPIEAVTMFDTGEKRSHNCHKCWSEFAGRVPCCPNCQSEMREVLTVSMVSTERAGYVLSRDSDAVEVTGSARTAMAEGETIAQLRGAPKSVQLGDLLALSRPRRTGYATARSGPAYGRR